MRIVISMVVFSSLASYASGNHIFYNGKKLDESRGPPSSFTGELSYRDMDSGKLTSRYQLIGGVREGVFEQFDEKTGKVTKRGQYHRDEMH